MSNNLKTKHGRYQVNNKVEMRLVGEMLEATESPFFYYLFFLIFNVLNFFQNKKRDDGQGSEPTVELKTKTRVETQKWPRIEKNEPSSTSTQITISTVTASLSVAFLFVFVVTFFSAR